jgi:hypothetical protein
LGALHVKFSVGCRKAERKNIENVQMKKYRSGKIPKISTSKSFFSFYNINILTVYINSVERKNGGSKNIERKYIEVLLMQLHHTLFTYKLNIWMLVQIIHAVLVKG